MEMVNPEVYIKACEAESHMLYSAHKDLSLKIMFSLVARRFKYTQG